MSTFLAARASTPTTAILAFVREVSSDAARWHREAQMSSEEGKRRVAWCSALCMRSGRGKALDVALRLLAESGGSVVDAAALWCCSAYGRLREGLVVIPRGRVPAGLATTCRVAVAAAPALRQLDRLTDAAHLVLASLDRLIVSAVLME